MDRSFWRDRRVLVTGHTGFKGAWLALWLERAGARVTGFALPPEHPSGAFAALGPWPDLDHVEGDLRDAAAVSAVVDRSAPEVVFHLGAQALVRRGYDDPVGTYETNVIGTANVLRAIQAAPSVRAVIVVTSDKVYANDGAVRAFVEDDPLGHTDPYSNSKACTELLVAAWRASYLDGLGIAAGTARAGNVIGGGDVADDRIVPDAVRAITGAVPLHVRNPAAIRPWQHVLEPLSGYVRFAEAIASEPGSVPAALNFGPEDEACRPVRELVDAMFSLWGAGRWEHDATPQPAEAAVLRLDSSRARSALGWRPRLSLDEALAWTVEWYRAQSEGAEMREVTVQQIESYEKRLREA